MLSGFRIISVPFRNNAQNTNVKKETTWTSGRVYGYENAMAANGFNTTQRISNFTHEFGHSLSMGHVTASGINAVMRQGKQALGTQSYDKENLKGKWGI